MDQPLLLSDIGPVVREVLAFLEVPYQDLCFHRQWDGGVWTTGASDLCLQYLYQQGSYTCQGMLVLDPLHWPSRIQLRRQVLAIEIERF